MYIARRRLLSLVTSAQRGLTSRVTLPALSESVASANLPSAQAPAAACAPPQPLGNARGFTAGAGSGLAGGCFVIRRVPQTSLPSLPGSTDGNESGSGGSLRCVATAPQPSSPGRGLSTSSTLLCNLVAGGGYSDLEEAPFGHSPAPSFAASGAAADGPHGSESESEDDDVAVAQVGGQILYGSSRIARAGSRTPRKPVEQQEARWIGSTSHSGDWSRASTVKPAAEPEPTVWGQILAACREDSAQLKGTVAMLHAASKQSAAAPPLPAFNKLVELAAKQQDMESVHLLVEMMSDSKLQPDEETHRQLEAAFAYNNRERSS